MEPIPQGYADRLAEEKTRQRDRVEGTKHRSLTVAMNELFPVRKCSVSRVAGRALIREAYRSHRMKRNSGGASRPMRHELDHADEMERRKIARRTRHLI